jgi:hypothetical protein
MAHDHDFDCQKCGAHFDTRDQLERHTKQQHSPNQQAGSSNVGSSSKNPSSVNRDRDFNS